MGACIGVEVRQRGPGGAPRKAFAASLFGSIRRGSTPRARKGPRTVCTGSSCRSASVSSCRVWRVGDWSEMIWCAAVPRTPRPNPPRMPRLSPPARPPRGATCTAAKPPQESGPRSLFTTCLGLEAEAAGVGHVREALLPPLRGPAAHDGSQAPPTCCWKWKWKWKRARRVPPLPWAPVGRRRRLHASLCDVCVRVGAAVD